MDSLRSAPPLGADAAEVIAQRAATLHLACKYGQASFTWPTNASSAHYWYAAEAIVPTDDDLPPVINDKDGFGRTARAARRSALRAFDGSRTTHLLARAGRVMRGAARTRTRPAIRASLALRLGVVIVLLIVVVMLSGLS